MNGSSQELYGIYYMYLINALQVFILSGWRGGVMYVWLIPFILCKIELYKHSLEFVPFYILTFICYQS